MENLSRLLGMVIKTKYGDAEILAASPVVAQDMISYNTGHWYE